MNDFVGRKSRSCGEGRGIARRREQGEEFVEERALYAGGRDYFPGIFEVIY